MFFCFCWADGGHPGAAHRPGVPLPGAPRADTAPRAGRTDSAAPVDKGGGEGISTNTQHRTSAISCAPIQGRGGRQPHHGEGVPLAYNHDFVWHIPIPAYGM